MIPSLNANTVSVGCGNNYSTALAVNVDYRKLINSSHFDLTDSSGVVLSPLNGLESCPSGTQVSLQSIDGSKNGFGKIIDVDNISKLVSITTNLSFTGFDPAPSTPATGEMLIIPDINFTRQFHYPELSNFIPTGIGFLNHVAPDMEEEIYGVVFGNNNYVPHNNLPVIDMNGNFVSIGDRKPGVFCRAIIDCNKETNWKNWSKPIAVQIAPLIITQRNFHEPTLTLQWEIQTPPSEISSFQIYSNKFRGDVNNYPKLTYFLSQYNHYQDLFNNCDSCDLATKNQYKTLISAYANQFSNLYNYYSSSQLLVTLPADSRKVDLTQSDFPFLPLRPWDTVKIVTKYISGQTSTTSMYFGGIGPFSYS